ncbi:MAG: hypothetical protein KatS3mg097_031 [Candidatus Parcubacteria bacterium]|nr:MAG: hypothetical protein KatS3mg097_031 [Candidatus Parcubacteria bacterium]
MIHYLIKTTKAAYNIFRHEKIITIVNIGITIVIAFFLWSSILSFEFLNKTIVFLEDKLNFSIYFNKNTPPEEINKIQRILENYNGVTEVTLVTREMAIEKFKNQIAGEPIILKALQEVNINPLNDYLIVKADNPEVYGRIADYLQSSPNKNFIESINYAENRKIIDKIVNVSKKFQLMSVTIISIIAFLSLLIIFNTTLVSIYSQKDYIEILRLIGAGNWFIRLPFLINSFFVVLTGYVIFFILFWIFLSQTYSFWLQLMPNFNPKAFIWNNIVYLNLSIFSIILIMNWIGNFLAIRKYLKI